MGFFDQKKEEKKDGKSRSFFQAVKDTAGSAARAVAGNSAKFVNQAYQEGKQAVNTGKMLVAQATDNDEAFRKANEQSQKDYKGFKDSGGLFNAGTFTDEEETKKGDLATGAKKIGAGTVGVATEIVPFARGATLAKSGGKALPNLGRAAAEGAAYGAVGGAVEEALDDEPFDIKTALKDTLIGAATGAAGFGIGKGIEKGVSKVKPVHAHEEKLSDLGGVRPGHETQTQIEAALNRGDRSGAQKIIDSMPEGDLKRGMQGTIDSLTGKPHMVDIRRTSPAEAKTTIASVTMDVKPVKRAKAALLGEEPKSESITPVGKGAESIAQKLDEQLASFNDKFAAPEEVIQALSKGDAVTRKARKHDWLNRYEDTLSVLGRHFGKTGTDLGYKLAEGAKKVSDIQEAVRPSIDKTQKILNKMSKSKSGRAEIQSRIYSALEDRANVDQYLRTPEERELFDEAVKVFDLFKEQRKALGKSVIENDYSPRAAVSSALEAPERLLDDARSAFSPDVKSRFSKERAKKIPDAEINRNIIDLLPMYTSSQSKEFAYEGAMKFAVENLKNVNPAYLTDNKARRQGEEYLRELLSQVLDPPTMSKAERAQNKLIAQTYKAQLGWSPRYALQNMTQRFATKSVVTKHAEKLAKEIDKVDVDQMRKGLFAGDSTITNEITNTADSVGKVPKKGLSKFEPGQAAERGNVHGAFDRGVSQALIESEPYKEAIKKGFKPKEAAKIALQDEGVRDLAIRRGNMVMNDTQFGANFVTKPEFFRETKSFFGLSDKWFKQYQRFPQGMIQNMSVILRANDARALDILKRGDPTQTNLVDFKYSAQALHNGVDDLIKGIKNGEITDVSLDVAKGYQKTLDNAIKELDKGMEKASLVRGGKTAKSIGKMWAAASAIQWLFDGGFAMTEDDRNKSLARAAQFGSPVSVPTRDQNPLAGAAIPSSPFRPEFQPRRLLNFVPGAGVVANRGREINRFVNALTGDTEQ